MFVSSTQPASAAVTEMRHCQQLCHVEKITRSDWHEIVSSPKNYQIAKYFDLKHRVMGLEVLLTVESFMLQTK